MEMKDYKRVRASRNPVRHNGITYERVNAVLFNLNEQTNQWQYSIELIANGGKSRAVAKLEEVEIIE